MAKWRLRLIWAVVAAFVAMIAVSSYLNSLRDMVPVVVATTEIPARSAVTADMLTVVHVNRADRAQLAKDAFSSIDEVVGLYARRRIESGEVVRNRPGDFTESTGAVVHLTGSMPLTDVLPPGTRAITLKLDKQAVMDQHIRAGDRVDIVFTSKSDSTGGVYSSLLVQKVMVLDIGRPGPDSPDPDYMVTLLVYLEQAVDLALAKRTGTVDLILNPPDPGDTIPGRVTSPLHFVGQVNPAPKTESPSSSEPARSENPNTAGR